MGGIGRLMGGIRQWWQGVAARTVLVDGALPQKMIGRVAAVIWILSNLLIAGSVIIAPPVGHGSRVGTLVVGITSLAFGVVLWFLPWDRLPRTTSLWAVPVAFAMIGLNLRVGPGNGFLYGIAFMMVFVWLGMAQRQGTCLYFAPLLIVAYAVPLLGVPERQTRLGLASMVFVVPACVLVGEALAWGVTLLSRSQAQLADTRSLYETGFEEAPIGIGVATVDGVLVRVNGAFATVVGLASRDLNGRQMVDLVHPDDRQALSDELRQLAEGHSDRGWTESRVLQPTGEERWISCNASVVRDRSGAARSLIVQIYDVTERRALREQLRFEAVHDQLTGLPNRTMFMERLRRSLERADRGGRRIALLFLDLDRFKLINDGLGHDAGDRLLKRVAYRLQGSLRPADLLARFGGDEFTVLCEVSDDSEAMAIAHRLRGSMERPLSEPDSEQYVTMSIGVAVSSPQGADPSTLLRQADMAMYRAKADGPDRVALYRDDDDQATAGTLQTANELHRALERQEFEVHYEPIVDLARQHLMGLEARIRWRHPTRGLLAPPAFAAVAIESGLIAPMGNWVLGRACHQAVEWKRARDRAHQAPDRFAMMVRVSSQQLVDPVFSDLVAAELEATGLDADLLWLQLDEATILGGQQVASTLREIRAIGVHVCLGDFGSGYSSLSSVKQLPVEMLKIDPGFVDGLACDPDDQAIVDAILALGRSLGLIVIADGIDRVDQLSALVDRGCTLGQGSLFGGAQPASSIGAFPADDLTGWPTGSATLVGA
jgi:diguanylate cyclase (GGDEF)-like protein/PAS domain S-box-containing protein